VVTALKNPIPDGWIGVPVTGQFGDWYAIDRAILHGADLPAGDKIISHGKGYHGQWRRHLCRSCHRKRSDRSRRRRLAAASALGADDDTTKSRSSMNLI
jgi:hypothetical protein